MSKERSEGRTGAPRKLIEVTRTDDLAQLSAVAPKLGIKIRVIGDPNEARDALHTQEKAAARLKHTEATEEQLERLASARWPQARIEEYTAEGATHNVVEFTFTGDYGRKALYDIAVHGGLDGRNTLG